MPQLHFLPLFIAGVWLEGKALLRRIVIVVRHPRPAGPAPQTGAAVFLGVVMLAVSLVVLILVNTAQARFSDLGAR